MAQQSAKPAGPVKITASAKPAAKSSDSSPAQFIFTRDNYRWLIISVAVVAFGFILMAGTTDIYSTTKIVVAPLVVLAGFGLGFYAIFKKPSVS